MLGLGEDRRALAGAEIIPDRLPRLGGAAERAEQIVAELEGHAHRRRVAIERRPRRGRGPRERRAEGDRPAHRVAPGLEIVHGLHVLGAPEHVDLLADDHVLVDAQVELRDLDHARRGYLDRRDRRQRHAPGEIAGEDRRRRAEVRPELLPEDHVHARPPRRVTSPSIQSSWISR